MCTATCANPRDPQAADDRMGLSEGGCLGTFSRIKNYGIASRRVRDIVLSFARCTELSPPELEESHSYYRTLFLFQLPASIATPSLKIFRPLFINKPNTWLWASTSVHRITQQKSLWNGDSLWQRLRWYKGGHFERKRKSYFTKTFAKWSYKWYDTTVQNLK